MKRSITVGLAIFALLLGVSSPAASSSQDYLAGRELSSGVTSGDITYLVLFAGWTLDEFTLDEFGWATIAESTGGTWTASIRREGEAGFDSSVDITGGTWTLQRPDGTTRWGRVLDGDVQWPDGAGDSLGCGDGVAVVHAEVSLAFPWGWPRRTAGEINGCLDDQEWLEPSDTFRLPPRIWATLTLY